MPANRRQLLLSLSALASVGQRLTWAQDSGAAAVVRRKVDSIDWYCELRGRGPTLVLVPSGEGDCGSFGRVADLLSVSFRVLTFDMPGFSRTSDPPNFDRYSISQAASEVSALIRALELGPATVYGCSSGGQIALRMAAEHSDLIRRAIVHEVAPGLPVDRPPSDSCAAAPALPPNATDEQIVSWCKYFFRNVANENAPAWDALGEEFHRRLERNYVTWIRRYFAITDMRMPTPAELRRRPVTWTIGALTEAGMFWNNVVAAHAADIPIELLPCKHFPQVSIPEALAEHISRAALG